MSSNPKTSRSMTKLNVRKANYLVPLEERMSKAAQLWVSFLIASLPRSKEEADTFPMLSFNFREIKRAINADGSRRITDAKELKHVHKELISTPLWYEDEKQGDMVAWLTRVHWDKRTDVFTYYFHPSLKPYLLNVKDHFTLYNYYYRVCLSSNGMKMYELLKMYQYLGEVELDVEEDIKKPLGLKGKYPKLYDLKRKVINPVQQEMAQFTDIRFEYAPERKDGKQILSFRFYIYANNPSNLPPPLLEALKDQGDLPATEEVAVKEDSDWLAFKEAYPDIFRAVKEWGGSESLFAEIMNLYGYQQLRYQINHAKRLEKEGKLQNPIAWLRRALADEYKDNVQERQRAGEAKGQPTRNWEQQKKALQARHDALYKEYNAKLQEICRELIDKDAKLLDLAVNELCGGHAIIRKAVQQGKTPQEIYDEKFTKWAVMKQIGVLRPEPFAEVENTYPPQIEAIKRKVVMGLG
jgi:hypothetical protein